VSQFDCSPTRKRPMRPRRSTTTAATGNTIKNLLAFNAEVSTVSQWDDHELGGRATARLRRKPKDSSTEEVLGRRRRPFRRSLQELSSYPIAILFNRAQRRRRQLINGAGPATRSSDYRIGRKVTLEHRRRWDIDRTRCLLGRSKPVCSFTPECSISRNAVPG